MALTKVTGQIIKDTTDVTVGVLTVTNTLAVGGTVSIGGTLTYEDVTNVDAVGLITARNGIVVGSGITLSKDGDIFATGITTVSGNVKVGSGVTLSPDGDIFATGVTTVSSRIDVISSENTLGILTSTNSGANLDLFDDDTQSRIRTVDGRLHLYADFKNEVSDSAIRFFIDGANEKLRITGIGSVGISSISPEKQLVVRTASGSRGGILVKPDVSFAANQNKSYLIVGTDGWTDTDDASGGDWNTYGFQHRIKSNSSGLSRVTIDNYLGEAFCVDNTSKVGITTDLPLARLDVRDTSSLGILSRSATTQATDTNKALRVRNNSTTDTFSVSYKGLTEIKKGEIGNYLTIGGDDADNGRALKFTSSTNESVGALHTLDAVSGNGEIALATAGAERMRFTQDGKVGVNSTSPAAKLDVVARGDTEIGIRLTDSNDAEESPYIEVIGRRADGNSSQCFSGKLHLARNRTDQKVSTNNMLGAVAFGGNHTDGDPSNILYTASIGAIASDNFDSSTDMPTDLVFMAGSTGRTPTAVNVSTGDERFRIKSAGDLQARRDGNGDIFRYYRAGTSLFVIDNLSTDSNTRIRIRNPGGSISYNSAASDITLKKNFESWDENVLDLFKNINPQKFNFKQEEDGTEKTKGFIAQEMVGSFPEAYSKGDEENAVYYFNPSGMVVYLMKGLQEAQSKIEVLEAEVAALKSS